MARRAVIWCAVSTKAQTAEDKISLPEQERAAREWCENNGYEVIKVLKVEGFSRRESDVVSALEEFQAQGVYAYHDLREMWKKSKQFDVLVAYTSSRFGRSASLHTWVIENTILSGANIYLIQGGWIDEHNHRFSAAIGSVAATSDIDRLVKARDLAMDARAKRGLPTTSSTILSHKLIRDERGRGVKIEVDESKRRLWDDLAALIIEGVSWKLIEEQLYQRFGHVASDGRPYRQLYMYNLVHHPTFWGHSARHFRNDGKGINGQRTDMWIFDPDEPPPDGVEIYYNTHEPVYTGKLAEQMKAELRRRRMTIRGTARPHRTHRFSGLFLCAECGYNLVHKGNKGYPAYACVSRHWQNEKRSDCSQRKGLPEWKIKDWLDSRLHEMIEIGKPSVFVTDLSLNADLIGKRIIELRGEITSVETQTRKMISKQATASDEVQSIYDEEIHKLGQRLKILKKNLSDLQHKKPSQDASTAQQRALEELTAMSLDAFWQLPDVEINQLLHRLIGQHRLVVEQGEIIGVSDIPERG